MRSRTWYSLSLAGATLSNSPSTSRLASYQSGNTVPDVEMAHQGCFCIRMVCWRDVQSAVDQPPDPIYLNAAGVTSRVSNDATPSKACRRDRREVASHTSGDWQASSDSSWVTPQRSSSLNQEPVDTEAAQYMGCPTEVRCHSAGIDLPQGNLMFLHHHTSHH